MGELLSSVEPNFSFFFLLLNDKGFKIIYLLELKKGRTVEFNIQSLFFLFIQNGDCSGSSKAVLISRSS